MTPLKTLAGLITGVDETGMEITPEAVKYEGKVETGILEPLVKLRVLAYNLTTMPPRIPRNIKVERGERGIIGKSFKVSWEIPKRFRVPRFKDIAEEVFTALEEMTEKVKI